MRFGESSITIAVLTGALLLTAAAAAQDYGPPPLMAPQQLDALAARIALYPDPLLAQVLAAATFMDQIPDAARWASDHRYLRGDDLANAIAQSYLPWDPSVQALLPFPDVLDMMARDMNWTGELGNAVLAQRPDVMDAVQRMRRQAAAYGYLRSNEQIRVVDGRAWTEIVPCNPAVIYVPVYDPYVVYAPPRPGFYVGAAIGFGGGFGLGVFRTWGWGGGFDWHQHTIIVNHTPWERNWSNRGAYVHNWNNWDGGRWHNPPVRREVVVNHVDVRRGVIPERDFRGNQRDFRRDERPVPAPAAPAAPAFRREDIRPEHNAPNVRESYRPSAPARQQEHGGRSESRGEERFRR